MRFDPTEIGKLAASTGFAPVRTLLAYSCAIWPSIFTGQYPDELDLWTEYHRLVNPRSSSSAKLLQLLPGLRAQRSVAYVMQSLLRLAGVELDLEPTLPPAIRRYFGRLGSDYRRLPSVPIYSDTLISAELEGRGLTWDYIFLSDATSASVADLAARARTVDLLIVVVSDTDHFGHVFRPLSQRFGVFLHRLDAWVGELREAVLAIDPSSTFLLTSDHGMTPVTKAIDVWRPLQKSGLRPGRDALVFLNATVMVAWFESGRAERIIEDIVAQEPTLRKLTRDEIGREHLAFSGRRYGDALYLAEPGVQLVPNFVSLERRAAAGAHGYSPDDPSTLSFVIGAGAARPTDVTEVRNHLFPGR